MAASVSEICPDCGMVLPAEPGLGGLCPKCLLGLELKAPPVPKATMSASEAPTLATPPMASTDSPTAIYLESLNEERESYSPGQLLGNRYRIESLLGRGGMGEVWRAYDLKLRLEVALKSVHRKLFETEDALELLRDEVRAAREVTSPNVCRLYDLIEVGESELVSMEYIDGVTLHEHLRQHGPLELKEANEIASQLLAGLEAVHDAGLVHRDIKPENVMLTRTGRVVVMDFGLTSPSGSGSIGGTPAYMPPEQAKGAATDARADVFSAGMVLAEMLSAERGPDESSRQAFWKEIREDPPLLPETPWKAILARAVAPSPNDRYTSAAELARALEEVAFRIEGAEHEHPYPGLESFQEEDAQFFFGREAEVEAVWQKLVRASLLGLVGPSGSGKSSFVNAGLLPARPEGWSCVRMSPGRAPFAALGRALLPELGDDPRAMGAVVALEDPRDAVEALRSYRARHDQVLLIVDQFEELFTQCSADVQQRFAELLGRAALDADLHVLLSMRDDFLLRCHDFDDLAPIFSELTPLKAPVGSALRRAVVQPALRCGYRFEDESIIEAMLEEVSKERGALPLIAFTAAQLWERRDTEIGHLTRKAYEAIGGVGGALAQHAEAILDYVGETNVPIVRELFRNLVTAQGTRASQEWEELVSIFAGEEGQPLVEPSRLHLGSAPQGPAASDILNTLIDARLLNSYEVPATELDEQPQRRIEIVHESLLSAWPRLVRWRTQDAEGAQLRDELRAQARLWDQHGRTDDYLWTGSAYLDFLAWRERYSGALTATEEAYARAMTALAERRRRRRRLAVASVLVLAIVVAAVTGGLWLRADDQARRAAAASLYSVAQAQLEDHPSGAVAYASKSLELADSEAARRLVMEALWKGPTEIRLGEGSWISLDFSPDGHWLATTHLRKGCRVFPSNGGPPVLLEDCESPMEGRFSPTGQSIAYALNRDRDRQEIKVWSFPEGRLLQSLELGGLATYFFRFDPEGRKIVTSTDHLEDRQYEVEIRSWPLEGGAPEHIARVEMPRESIGAFVGVDPSLSRLVWSEGARLRLAAIENGTPDKASLATIEQDQLILMTAFESGSRRIATLDSLGVPRIWSAESVPPRMERNLPPADRGMVPSGASFRFNDSGSMLAHAHGFLWRLEAPLGAELQSLRLESGAVEGEDNKFGYGVAFHPNGQWVATSHPQSVSLWPLARRFPFVLRGHQGWVKNVRIAPDGDWLVSTAGDNTVRVWPIGRVDVEGPAVLHELDGAYPPSRHKIAPDGSYVALATYTGQVLILPMDGGEVRTLSGFNDVVKTVAIGPQSRLVAAGSGFALPEESIVRVWDLETGESHILDDGTRERLHRVEFEDQETLLVASRDGTLKRWKLDEEAPRKVGEFEISGIALDIRPDLGLVLTSTGDPGSLGIYDLKERRSLELSSHGVTVASATLDPSGRVVASVDKQGIVRVGPVSGEEPHLLLGHKGEINHVTFSPDGQWIATGGDDELIYLWPTPDLSRPPLHIWPREDLLTKLETLTNLRAVEDPDSPTGWKLVIGPFPGWEEVPEW